MYAGPAVSGPESGHGHLCLWAGCMLSSWLENRGLQGLFLLHSNANLVSVTPSVHLHPSSFLWSDLSVFRSPVSLWMTQLQESFISLLLPFSSILDCFLHPCKFLLQENSWIIFFSLHFIFWLARQFTFSSRTSEWTLFVPAALKYRLRSSNNFMS